MTDQRDEDLEPTTTAAVDATGMPIDPDQIDAPASAPMDGAAGGPQADTSEDMGEVSSTGEMTDEEVAAQLSSPA